MRKRYYWDKKACEWVEKRPVIQKRTQFIDREKVMGDGVRAMFDGKVYTNRAQYEAEVKAREMVVLGNDVIEHREYQPASAIEDIRRAWGQIG